jgi:RNA polymerase sigma factor (sigma-70 family)
MLEDAANAELLAAWRDGNQQAATILVRRYMTRLTALARAKLSRLLARRVDPEDVVLSAWRSFFVRAETCSVSPNQDDDLWPLLASITLRKLARQASRHAAAKRAQDRELPGDDDLAWDEIASREPTPEQAAALADDLKRLFAELNPLQVQILERRLQGEEQAEIARELGCSERTVRRALGDIRQVARAREIEMADVPARSVPLDRTRTRLEEPLTDHSVRLPPHAAPAPTLSYNRYLLESLIGEGSLGKVYRARELDNGETVAVKFLRKRLWKSARAKHSLLQELAITAELQLPHIVHCHGWGTTPHGALFLAMDYVDGPPIDRWQAATNPPPARLYRVIHEIADTLAALHAQGVVHGDLTPANVLIDGAGQVFLTDFEFARSVKAETIAPRGGTPAFLAPEHITDAFGRVSTRTDVYGFGALLYLLLTGQPPGKGTDVPSVLADVLSAAAPIPPHELSPQGSPGMERFHHKLSAKGTKPSPRLDASGSRLTA